MNAVVLSVACGIAGYLIGSIPFGYLIVKAVKGIDIREFGSGRTGGTNVYRAAGAGPFVLTATLDVLKGVAAVLLVRHFVSGTAGWAEALAGLGVVLGHNASCFLNFRGGAGGATAVGTSIAVAPLGGVIALVLGGGMLFIGGYASVASILAGAAVAIFNTVSAITGLGPWAYAAYGWGVLGLILFALRPNIERLRAGTEKRVSWFKRPQSSSTAARQ